MQLAAFARSGTRKREAVRFLKFAAVGTLGFVIDYSILNLLILGAGFPKFLANFCSFSVAVVSNFIWNRIWTYPESRSRPVGSQLGQFAVINVIGLAINMTIFLSADRYLVGVAGIWAALARQAALHAGISHRVFAYNFSKACATVVALFWNFGGNRLWTYRGL